MLKCKFYSEVTDKCTFDGPPDDCPYQDDPSKCNCFKPKMIEYGSSDAYEDKARAAEEARRKSLIKLELVQYPYSKAGRPTIYLDDYQIAGPRAFGVGRTVESYELTKENLKDIQRIVTRELNRMNGIE